MNPFPLITRTLISGGILALAIYELAKRGAKMNKSETTEAERPGPMVSSSSDFVNDVKTAAKDVAERVKESVNTVAEIIEEALPPMAKVEEALDEVVENVKSTTKSAAEAIEDIIPESVKEAAEEVVKSTKSKVKDTAKTVKDSIPEDLKEAAESMADAIKEDVEEIGEIVSPTTNIEYLKIFAEDDSTRVIKIHITKSINALLEAGESGHYQIAAVADEDLAASLLADYTKKYKSEIEAGKISIHHKEEGENHFLSVKL